MSSTDRPSHPLYLASGTLPEFDPVAVVEAAAAAGFAGSGVWFEADGWSPSQTQAIATAFANTGLIPLEIEVLIVGDNFRVADAEPLFAAGGAIGCTEAIVVSTDADHSRFAQNFAQVAELASQYSINACLEFLPIFSVATLAQALWVLEQTAQPNAKLLLDPIHVARSGATLDNLLSIDSEQLSFAQFCDGVAELAGLTELSPEAKWAALRDDAVDGRSCPGEGELDLADFLTALPAGVPLSMELRSKVLRERYPAAAARAKAVFDTTYAWFER